MTSGRDELGRFLRSRRAAVNPGDVGLPTTARRRTPGLRREEVATLAGVSVSWYTWLEQGRPINASREVLDALARTLRLNRTEHDHLLALAERAPSRPSAVLPDPPPSLVRLIAALEPSPAYVLGPRWEFVAWNRPQARLFPTIERMDGAERNLIWAMFGRSELASMLVDFDGEARRVVSQFRADTDRLREDTDWRSLVDRLCAASARFRELWAGADVAPFETRLRSYDHPRAGRLAFEYQQLVPAAFPDLRVVVHLPIAGDDSTARLAAWHEV